MLTSVIIAKSSPPTSPNGSRPTSPNPMLENRHTAQAKRRKFMRRILMFRQMDFEFAMWQMIYLLVSPQKVYRNFQYSKQTKDQWARDDPAFLVLLSICLCASSVGFAIVLQLGVLHFFKFLLWVVFVDCIGVGLLIATVLWFVANRYLRVSGGNKPDVEWGFAFDVHLNAFFPLLIILHVVQLLLYIPLLDRSSFLSTLLGNTLWLIAITYYIYVTFLGYSALPFLRRTVAFLYPPCLVLICIFVISLLTNWNIARSVMYFYEYRVY
ncbi:protein unc-50 homolog [Acanthaster planci]|uniref:Protein unc-50 homolog n=1 Tax=Acanthaster planci TaxID=133434 RepID=A0A8B7XGY5_ACAPL|nr:protein unc-50 homolog [Acanthaster planci]XP_022079470.1 protein unc-50 homolog [Acanthaster planci]XP_022079471.1 protein unc-50 homolog [Acanthaster planci]XP_022079472.1 protein unc-50 homolog [Acanthaster planci]